MARLRRFAAFVAVSAMFATGIPQVAMAAPRSSPASAAVVVKTSSGSGSGSGGQAWGNRFGSRFGFTPGGSKAAPAEDTTFKWSAPQGRSTPRVRVDPHAHRVSELTG